MAESAEVLALPVEGGAAPLGPQPGEVWSLWDMLRAYAHEFATVDRGLEYLFEQYRWAGTAEFRRQNGGKEWIEVAAQQLKAADSWLDRLPVSGTVTKQFARARKVAAAGDAQETYMALREFLSRFRDDMEELHFLHVTPALSGGLGDSPPFGEGVEQAFPSSALEIRDAARCLALGQGTAAVFHCMRALEPALIALGTEFGVSVRENWNDALNATQNAIRARTNKNDRPSWKEEEPFYTEACTHFFIIKNAWRNHTMHLRSRFTEQDALKVYDHTRLFMQHLSTRLSEDVEGASPGEGAP